MWNYLSITTSSATASGPSRWVRSKTAPAQRAGPYRHEFQIGNGTCLGGRGIPPVRNRINDSARQGKRSAAQPGGRSKLRS